MDDLVNTFLLNSLSPSDSVFDMDKLLWFNKEYIRKAPIEEILKNTGLGPELKEKVLILRENARTLNEIKDMLSIFDGVDIDREGIDYLQEQKDVRKIIESIEAILKNDINLTFEHLTNELQNTINIKKRDMFMILRIIFTGRKSGPPLGEIFHLIPKDTIMKRITWFISLIL
jgi:glutamyl/glutaminyl-tRNA synthetase